MKGLTWIENYNIRLKFKSNLIYSESNSMRGVVIKNTLFFFQTDRFNN